MRVAVVGSRNINNKKEIFDILSRYDISIVVSGGALGVDTIAEEYAENINIGTDIYLPDWKKYGKSAGFIRNKDIINNSDMTIAFWDGKSKGTLNSIEYSRKINHPTIVWIFQDNIIYNWNMDYSNSKLFEE
ncbi:MAG: DUF2493 domain-containing protein [Flavobacterium sp.]|uniref:DUF2493 domain-containing protein n=1 Tax=Flavobacterium sp. TaxID=239 RepID=UPI00260F70A7|nr:DUF2493 domain-containing protein [Flavobacterium sp.]MDD5151798.1 DUF2493 domain-containing protein [Flavobacterium sp.]